MVRQKVRANQIPPGAGAGATGAPSSGSTTKPLPRGPHTLQLVFHLAVCTVLLALSTLVLPAHLLASRANDSAPSTASTSDAAGAAAAAGATESISASTSPLSLASSVVHVFRLPAHAPHIVDLRKLAWSSLTPLLLTQAWSLIRFKKWYDLGHGIESGDRDAVAAVTKRGWAKGAEMLTMTTTNVPIALLAVHLVLFLVGAPAFSVWPSAEFFKGTLCLSIAVLLLVVLPLCHLLPESMDEWTRVLGSFNTQSPRERLLLWQTFIPVVSAVVASSALTFDHGKAWLAWPLPPLFGLYAGALLANVFGGLEYLLLGRS